MALTPFERAEERYRLATIEVTAARAEEDAYLSLGEQPPPGDRKQVALRELLAAQVHLARLTLGEQTS